ncbi:Transposase IS801 [Edwardsiella anguillarum]|uniref:Transposase zinc-binding domain-containing protein n=1 Tax=Edwardsiella anguillarum TaxID=1821960 RepID=A0ABY8SL31_9GAMM|nr:MULTISPECIES: transposase zinc-binding domain-containing protein [Edwardsiella]UBU95005.1 transposase zinc-binding domain-containing protein [Edwardsiella sp. LADL05-105]UOU80788.1 transposase zinc-binding domain-containing protein [Edwardsiella anguillarum]WHP85533.1 transposase zinc-binding domain-containing protein [Edwardsiella anguillarum]WHP89315.1 transposase zinc-binding domain-containing protein [Edwardsiella anguillarum]WHP93115.1 transposase zinc-binding domain-containing protein
MTINLKRIFFELPKSVTRLWSFGHLHDRSFALYSAPMYIPRPAKLLFTFDNGWNRYLEKHGDNVSQWTLLSVERMLACGTCVMCARHYCCGSPDCTHSRFFCQSCKSKACSSCGMQATEQWIAEQQHILPDCDWQHITFTMPPAHSPVRHLRRARYQA